MSGGDARRAIDGNTNGEYEKGSVTHTAKERNPWWGLLLEEEKNIQEIVIFNRTDSDAVSNLSSFTITVYDKNNKLTFSKVVTKLPTPSLSIDVGGVIGSKVKVQLNGTGSVSLAELEVY